MDQKVEIIRGIRMPFFPMRPSHGAPVRNKMDALALWAEVKDETQWIAQPKLNDDRVVLAFKDGSFHVQNRHGSWYTKSILNLEKWRELPNLTVLDGGVYKGEFYPFELLATWGKSMMQTTVQERVVGAFQMSRLCGVKWMFDNPSKGFIVNSRKNMPAYDGVVLKRRSSPYIIAGTAEQESDAWVKRRWC